jgi:hypothetical protein
LAATKRIHKTLGGKAVVNQRSGSASAGKVHRHRHRRIHKGNARISNVGPADDRALVEEIGRDGEPVNSTGRVGAGAARVGVIGRISACDSDTAVNGGYAFNRVGRKTRDSIKVSGRNPWIAASGGDTKVLERRSCRVARYHILFFFYYVARKIFFLFI